MRLCNDYQRLKRKPLKQILSVIKLTKNKKMRVNPELLMIRKFNDLLAKYSDKDSIPKNDIVEFKKDIEDMIKHEVSYSKLYLNAASEFMDIE